MNGTKLIHVRLREPFGGETDYFFGSLAAIYDVLPEAAVGINYNSLRCRFARLGHRYENHRCIIRRASVHRKKMNKNK